MAPRDVGISNLERNFLLQALQTGRRFDRRGLTDYRQLDLSFESDPGTAKLCLGKTQVLACVSAEVIKPREDRPFDGMLLINAELNAMVSPAYESGRPSTAETLLNRILDKAIRRSSAIDLESLCIVSGKKCWSIRVDIHILNADGGLIDACCIVTMAALLHFRRPDVTVNGERAVIHSMKERSPVPLSILHIPICVTFSIFEGNVWCCDTTKKEEEIRTGEMTFSIDRYGEMCQISKYGGVVVEAYRLMKATMIAAQKAQEIAAFIRKRVEQEAKSKDVGGLKKELQAENER